MKNAPILLALTLALLACNSKTKPTSENYLSTINAYFPDHQDCLLDGSITFPYETSNPATTKQMDALVKAQILEAHTEPSIHVSRYTLTPTGTKAGNHLCYGHREATAIISSTPPAPANGFTETNVTYAYKIEDLPVWAKTPEVLAAYPKMAHEASGDATDKITLAPNRRRLVRPQLNWFVLCFNVRKMRSSRPERRTVSSFVAEWRDPRIGTPHSR